MKILSRAPTRIDLAGGTVDLWPIYLFLPQAKTINLGISLFAETELDTRSHPEGLNFKFTSEDQSFHAEYSASQVLAAEEPPVHPSLILHFRLTRHFLKKHPSLTDRQETVHIHTRAKSPAGAGLGGSSTLSVSIVGALARWANHPVQPERDGVEHIDIVKDVETTVIKVPAGMQDYYGAMFGGLQLIRWNEGKNSRESLGTAQDGTVAELKSRLTLFYSGQSRNSGINNWTLFKSFIDGEKSVQEKFRSIVAATTQLEAALCAKNWAEAGLAIDREWQARRTLAAGISTPEIDAGFAEVRSKIAPNAAMKVCGAGGGGCFFIYEPAGNPETQNQMVRTLETRGMRHLPFSPVLHGLDVNA